MNLEAIKSQLGVESLQLNTAKDKEDKPTSWMRHWDNDRRIAISIHKDLVAELQSDSTISSLGLKTETREGAKGEYISHIVVKYKPAEVTL